MDQKGRKTGSAGSVDSAFLAGSAHTYPDGGGLVGPCAVAETGEADALAGLAVAYRRYSKRYVGEENAAKAAKVPLPTFWKVVVLPLTLGLRRTVASKREPRC